MVGWARIGWLGVGLVACARQPLRPPERPDLVLSEQTLSFQGRTWWMRSPEIRAGAGPGWWTDAGAHVVDHALELELVEQQGRWRGVELLTPLPSGRTGVAVELEVEALPADVILGVFLYRSDTSEVDVELGQWGDRTAANAQFAVGPASRPGNVHRFEVPEGPQTFTIDVRAHEVVFEARWAGGVYGWTYPGPDVPSGQRHALHLNLWPFDGQPDGPAKVRILSVNVGGR